MPTISIVMPAYNAERYIAEAIASVKNQDFSDWELIIVDDASTDNTLKIIEYYAQRDARIKYVSNRQNSGSARLPRLKAVSLASSNWIFSLDADDFIADDCLSRMNRRTEATGSDIVIGQMILINEKGESIAFIPQQGYDMDQIMTGKQACAKTIGGWEIGFNCSLVPSDCFKKLPNDGHNEMNMDEVDTRRLLLFADSVSFCDAAYYYRQRHDSISRRKSIKLFDKMCTSCVLMSVLLKAIPENREILTVQIGECWANVSNSLLSLFKYYSLFSMNDRMRILRKIRMYYGKCRAQRFYIKMNTVKKTILLKNFICFFLIKVLCFYIERLKVCIRN